MKIKHASNISLNIQQLQIYNYNYLTKQWKKYVDKNNKYISMKQRKQVYTCTIGRILL